MNRALRTYYLMMGMPVKGQYVSMDWPRSRQGVKDVLKKHPTREFTEKETRNMLTITRTK